MQYEITATVTRQLLQKSTARLPPNCAAAYKPAKKLPRNGSARAGSRSTTRIPCGRTRYVIAWARVELCTRHKSPSSVTRRGSSIGLTWLARGPKPEFPPLLSASRSSQVVGEGGCLSVVFSGPCQSAQHRNTPALIDWLQDERRALAGSYCDTRRAGWLTIY